jgi:hypothetical protein
VQSDKKRNAQDAVLRVLQARFGAVPPAVKERVEERVCQSDDEVALEELLTLVATAPSLAETGLP